MPWIRCSYRPVTRQPDGNCTATCTKHQPLTISTEQGAKQVVPFTEKPPQASQYAYSNVTYNLEKMTYTVQYWNAGQDGIKANADDQLVTRATTHLADYMTRSEDSDGGGYIENYWRYHGPERKEAKSDDYAVAGHHVTYKCSDGKPTIKTDKVILYKSPTD